MKHLPLDRIALGIWGALILLMAGESLFLREALTPWSIMLLLLLAKIGPLLFLPVAIRRVKAGWLVTFGVLLTGYLLFASLACFNPGMAGMVAIVKTGLLLALIATTSLLPRWQVNPGNG